MMMTMRGKYLKTLGVAFLCLGFLSVASKAYSAPTEIFNVTNTVWRYFNPPADTDPGWGNFWRDTDFDDSLWPTGQGMFGWETSAGAVYGVPGAFNGGGGGSFFNTEFTSMANGGSRTDYLRTTFTWAGDANNLILTGTLRIDDACIIYVNGQEAYRYNIDTAIVDPDYTTAGITANPEGEPNIIDIDFPGTNVVGGGIVENVIAVFFTQAGANSSDKVFGLDLFGDTSVAPTITTQPVGTNVLQGRPFTLEVVAEGLPAPTYQWYFNDSAITDATDSTYTVDFAEPGVHNGNYYVEVSNAAGTVNSDTVAVGVSVDNVDPEFSTGAVLQDGTVRLVFDEAMSNSFDTFSVFVFEAGGGGAFIGIASWVIDADPTTFIITPSDPLTVGINYEVFIGVGAVQDIFGNVFSRDEGQGGIIRPLATELIVVPITANWVYDDTVPPLELITNTPPRFYDVAFDDTSWSSGPAPLGTETDGNLPDGLVINTTVLTTGAGGPNCWYARHKFFLPGALNTIESVRVRTLNDDGFVLYVNGTEVQREGVPQGEDSTTFANRTVGNADWEGFYDIPLNLLNDGENVIAASVFNTNPTSSDIVWGAEVVALVGEVIITEPTIESQTEGPITLTEGVDPAPTLNVVATGTPPLTYQWSLNGTDIPDGTNSTYTLPSVTVTNAGDYVCVVNNISDVPATSATITVNVIADLTSPTLVSAVASLDNTEIQIVFSETISRFTATNPANYTVSLRAGGAGPAVLSADYVGGSRSNIVLTTDPRDVDNYNLTVQDLTDRSQAGNLLDPNPTTVELATEVILVDYDAIGEWAYNDSGRNFDDDYFLSTFNPIADEGWYNGAAFFYAKRGTPGTLDLPVTTTLDLTNAPGVTNRIGSAQTICFYFRGNIDLTGVNLAEFQPLKFQYILDDAMRVYVNESEAFRVGMPEGVITNETLADRSEGNDQFWETPEVFDSSGVVAGDNLIAVDVHQTSITSSDLAFALRLIGTKLTIEPPLRITGISLDGSNNIIITHNGGTTVYVQETTALNNDPSLTSWATRPGGPHASPHNAGLATGQRFFRLSDTP